MEDDCFGLTEDMLQPRPKTAVDTAAAVEDEEMKEEPAEGRWAESLFYSGPEILVSLLRFF